MQKNASNEPSQGETTTGSLQQTFWRWFSFSVLALALAAALPARSADVFIDEGDGDFAATPVSSPAAAPTKVAEAPVAPAPVAAPVAVAPVKAGPKPASEDQPIANPGSELDSQIGQLEPSTAPGGTGADPMAGPGEPKPMDPVAEPPVEKPKKAAAKKTSSKKKTAPKASKSKKKDKKPAKKASKKKDKKSAKKKKKPVAASTTTSKRKVASVTKFAGGQYATTSKDCTMESTPGAGDAVGTSKAARKLWVEESGNTSYYKVYGKSGTAAYLPRECF